MFQDLPFSHRHLQEGNRMNVKILQAWLQTIETPTIFSKSVGPKHLSSIEQEKENNDKHHTILSLQRTAICLVN